MADFRNSHKKITKRYEFRSNRINQRFPKDWDTFRSAFKEIVLVDVAAQRAALGMVATIEVGYNLGEIAIKVWPHV